MHLVTFTFEVQVEDQIGFIKEMESLKSFWEKHGIHYDLYQDKTRNSRFLQLFQTEMPVDQITRLIQNDPQAKAVFERIRSVSGRMVVSFLNRVV